MTEGRGKRLSYIPALDGVRAGAVLLVMLSHIGVPLVTGGGFGVDIFFVLSGFLITTLLLEEIDVAGRIDVLKFYARRLLRLYPALLLMLLLYALFCDLLRHSLPHMEELVFAKDIAFAGLYLTDYAVALWFENRNSLIGHTWSLAVEEHFYLLWPFVLPWLRRVFPGKKLVLALLAFYALATLWRLVNLSFEPWDAVYFRFDTRFSGLLLGAALAAMRRHKTKLPYAEAGLLFSGLLFGICVITMSSMAVKTYALTVAEVFAFFLLWQILDAPKGAVARVLSNRVAVYLGQISYGLYLFHFPAGTLFLRADQPWGIGLTVMLAVSLGLAWFSWNTVEKAGRLLARGFRRPAAERHVPE